MAQRNEVIDFETRRRVSAPGDDGAPGIAKPCANPDCVVLIERTGGRGRSRDYHDDDCQRAAAEAQRTLERQQRQTVELLEGINSHLERYNRVEKAPKSLQRSTPQLSSTPDAGNVDVRALLTELLVAVAGSSDADVRANTVAALGAALANPSL